MNDDGAGKTPLDPDETGGLIPRHISTQGALNEWEQQNILLAVRWLRKARVPEVLTERFCRELHRRMFGKTWRWAGQFRRSDKNIGCEWKLVAVKLHQLLGNTRYWIDASTFPPDEIAARFHHQLVWIHAFPNGNGRHARLMTDALLKQIGRPEFSWGSSDPQATAEHTREHTRRRYLAALRAADQNDFAELLAFVRS